MKRQITISGYPGAGKSTTGKLLASRLGYDFFSAGHFRREAAKELDIDIDTLNLLENLRAKINGYPSAEILDKLGLDRKYHPALFKLLKYGDTDVIVDEKQKSLATTKDPIIVEGRLAYMHFPDAFKVFFYCEPEIAASRIFKDKRDTEKEFASESEVLERITSSMQSDRQRYITKYGDIGDCYSYRPEKFDLYIDTTNLTNEMVIANILEAYIKAWE